MVRKEGGEDSCVYIEGRRVAEVEGHSDCIANIPVEHAEVCIWDIAECELDENTRKALSTLTLTLTLTGGLAESAENAETATSTLLSTFTQTLSLTINSHN